MTLLETNTNSDRCPRCSRTSFDCVCAYAVIDTTVTYATNSYCTSASPEADEQVVRVTRSLREESHRPPTVARADLYCWLSLLRDWEQPTIRRPGPADLPPRKLNPRRLARRPRAPPLPRPGRSPVPSPPFRKGHTTRGGAGTSATTNERTNAE